MKWISVKDRLPELGKYVLVFNSPHMHVLSLNYRGLGRLNDLVWDDGGDFEAGINDSHYWMPLPEVPETIDKK